MITKIDFANKTYITYIIILIIILFGIIYIWQNFKSNKHIDGFTQYNINSNDTVSLFALDNVLIGNESLTLPQQLGSLYYKITDGSKMDIRLSTEIDTMKSDIAAYKKELSNSMSTNKTELTNSMTTEINKITDSVDTNIITLQNNINANTPQLTIIAYYGMEAPLGWQICDGQPLKAEDNKTNVYYKIGTDTLIILNTPDLRGRSILGLNTDGALTKTKLGVKGGEEKHKIFENEMAGHYRWYSVPKAWYADSTWGCGGCPTKYDNSDKTAEVTTANQPHNNVHPVYVLNYIIKQPKRGGTSPSTNVITMPDGFINPTTDTIFTS